MKLSSASLLCCGLLALTAMNAQAAEEETEVPLMITKARGPALGAASVTLTGEAVEIDAELRNETSTPAWYGFYADTPLFQVLGMDEEHVHKDFGDLAVSLNDQPFKLAVSRRGFFLGHDITGELLKAGLDPLPTLPDTTASGGAAVAAKLKKVPRQFGIALEDSSDWQGMVSYAWSGNLPASSAGSLKIRYQALPQFGRAAISDQRFARLVRQHCGDVGQAVAQIRRLDPHLAESGDYVLFERYVIPLPSGGDGSDVRLKVAQPTKNWMGGHPMLTLVCGLAAPYSDTSSVSGVIGQADSALSILIISTMAG